MRKVRWQYRICWQYEGTKRHNVRIFNHVAGAEQLLHLLTSDTPWYGMTQKRLRVANALLARLLHVPPSVVLEKPVKQAISEYRALLRPILWLRVDRRQVMNWTELGDPLHYLVSPGREKRKVKVDQYIAHLDAHIDEKWNPDLSFVAGMKYAKTQQAG